MEVVRKKNEATYITFPMVTTANPETFDTGETVTDTAYYKDGAGAWTSLAITDTVSEIGTTGVYSIDLTAAEMNHDIIMIKFTSTNAADTAVIIHTYARDFDDLAYPTTSGRSIDVTAAGEVGLDFSNVSGTLTNANLAFVDSNERVDVGEWLGNAVTFGTGGPDVNVNAVSDDTTAAVNMEAAFDGSGYNVGAGLIVASSVAGDVTVGTIQANTITAGSIAASALNGKGDWNVGKTGYSISGTKTTLDALNDVSTAEVNAQVDTALVDIHLDHLLAVNYDPASKPGVATALLNELVENDGGVSRFTANALEQAPGGGGGGDATAANQTTIINHLTDIKGGTWSGTTDSLEAIRDRGDAAWVTGAGGSAPTVEEIRTEMDNNSTQLAAIVADTNELQTDWANGGRLDVILDARASQTSVDTIDTNVDAILVDTGTTLPAQISGLNNFDPASDKVILADSSSHGGPNMVLSMSSMSINSSSQHGLSIVTSAANRDAIHLEANGTGTPAGINAFGNWSGIVASNMSGSSGNGMRITSNGTGAGLDTFSTSGAAIDTGTTGGTHLGTNIKADINAEVVDVLTVDTHAEPGSVPAATASLRDKIGWLFSLARNRMTQTASQQALRNDADSGNIGTANVSDNGTTAERSEWQ